MERFEDFLEFFVWLVVIGIFMEGLEEFKSPDVLLFSLSSPWVLTRFLGMLKHDHQYCLLLDE